VTPELKKAIREMIKEEKVGSKNNSVKKSVKVK